MARWFRHGLSVPALSSCRCLTSRVVLRFHIPLIEPDVRISRIRLSDKASCVRPRKSLVRQAHPSLRHAMPPAAPGPQWGDRHRPLPRSLAASCTGLELRPLPSVGVTRLRRYYGPLRHPTRPGLALAGCRLEVTHLHRWGFPCCTRSPCASMPSPAPRRDRWVLRSSRPATAAFPESQAGRLPCCLFRGLLGVHSRYGLHARQVAQGDPLHQRLRLLRLLHNRSDCYWQERQLPGGNSTR